MAHVDQRLQAAMLEQLAQRRETLAAGAQHLGWKLGVGDRENIGGSIAVGYLTSATRLDAPATYRIREGDQDLRADVELTVELRHDFDSRAPVGAVPSAIVSYRVGLEIVDLTPAFNDAAAVVAGNIFHRAVAFGPAQPRLLRDELVATARINGEQRDSMTAIVPVAERLLAAACVLEAVGERLRRGDLIITGSIVQIGIAPGDAVEAEIAGLGSVGVKID